MKYILFGILGLLLFTIQLSGQTDNEVLFTVEGNPVTVEEFRYIYEKNNGAAANYSKESVMEYLDLYKKFKLKVARAKELQLDTVPALQNELAGYRKQLANSYLNDKEVTTNLIDEVIERMKTDREVSHIFLPLDAKSSHLIKNKVNENVKQIYKRLQNGEDFAKLAKEVSLDQASAINGGYLGYYVAPLPSGFYAFENAMYSTPIGKYSEPILSKMGYHIIKVTNERPAKGEMTISHLVIKKDKNGVVNKGARTQIDSIYRVLLEDTSQFKSLASQYSEDKNTAAKGGFLGKIKINQFDIKFEEAAFALKNDGDISPPIESKLGWHIIQRQSKEDYTDTEKLKRTLKAKVVRDDRLEISKQALIESIKKEANLVVNKRALNIFNTKLTEDFYSYKWKQPELPSEDLLTFNNGEKVFTLSDFADFCKRNTKERLKYTADVPTIDVVNTLFATFTNDAVLQYEESNLEKKYPAFKALMREYEEGILLFETTKQEVWDKASQDTVGLQKFYSEHTSDYQWGDRVKLSSATVKSDDAKTIAKIEKALAKKKTLSAIQSKYNGEKATIVVKDDEIVSTESPLLKGLQTSVGSVKTTRNADKSMTLTRVAAILPAGNKSFDEAKGYIIADYQDYLEQEWIADLKSRYQTTINEEVLAKLIK